ncbi:hypothetical protein [Haladaptatus cibarius]|uniref:hypothetical protein n=1 Tax=Haladaptatus cibarius TaxID=453847 RepID=UPI000679B4C4|nr:hypothetical protein [Haladaptatus cibarius]
MNSLDTLSRLSEDGHDIEACRYCDDHAVVAVLDQRIATGMKPGNRYRRYCLGCETWNPMSSKEYFEEHPLPHVLPTDANPDDPTLILLSKFEADEDDEAERLAEIQARFDHDDPDDFETAATDADYQAAIEADEPEPDAKELENRFNCDHCGAQNTGYPAECRQCDAIFRWTADQRPPEETHA